MGEVRCTHVHNHQYSATLKNEKAYEAVQGSSALHRVSRIRWFQDLTYPKPGAFSFENPGYWDALFFGTA
jgi:hypothetical protein